MSEFFDSETVKQVLASEQMVLAVANSRFMSYLLISKAVKYFRDRPQEAARIIASNPHLKALQGNPHIRKAVEQNTYLKPIATILLGGNSTTGKAQKTSRKK